LTFNYERRHIPEIERFNLFFLLQNGVDISELYFN
jgi:hypothetical protein